MIEKIEEHITILREYLNGQKIQYRKRYSKEKWKDVDIKTSLGLAHYKDEIPFGDFNFDEYEYRVKPTSSMPKSWEEYLLIVSKEKAECYRVAFENLSKLGMDSHIAYIKLIELCKCWNKGDASKAYLGDYYGFEKRCDNTIRPNQFICKDGRRFVFYKRKKRDKFYETFSSLFIKAIDFI